MRSTIVVDPPSATSDGEPDHEPAEPARESHGVAMGQVSAAIAHEVVQPIAACVIDARAALRWLAGDPPDLDEARQALLRIVESGSRASAIIGQGRALARKALPDRSRFDINAAIREVVALVRREAVNNGVSLRTKLARDLPLLQGDRVQLQQVVVNLVVNAIEAMIGSKKAAREVVITTARDGALGMLVAVRDTGPGIPSICFNRVFEPFYTTKPHSLGMGLAICRSIVDAHGGRLSAAHNEPRGATFQFTLP